MVIKELLSTSDIAKKNVYLSQVAKEKLKVKKKVDNVNISSYIFKNLTPDDIRWVENDRKTQAPRFPHHDSNYYAKFPDEIQEYINELKSVKYASGSLWEFAIYVDIRDGLNRLHFDGLPNEFRGLGLGFKMYKSLINYLGYASSADNATVDAQRVWLKLLNDDEFNSILIRGRVLIMRKDLDPNTKENLVNRFVNEYFVDVELTDNKKDILIDTELLNIILGA